MYYHLETAPYGLIVLLWFGGPFFQLINCVLFCTRRNQGQPENASQRHTKSKCIFIPTLLVLFENFRVLICSNYGREKMCILRKRNYKYQCTQCSNIVCVVCAEKVKEDCVGYDEESYRVGKCPQDKCAQPVNSGTDGKSGKRKKNTANTTLFILLLW